MTFRFLSGLLAVLVLLASGCKDPDGATGGTTGVALYAFDSTTSKVFVWKDLSALYDSTEATPAPTYQLSSGAFTKVTSLAWGGAAVDSQRGLLYLVSSDGNIVRVTSLRSQTGAIASTDVVSFKLASASFLNGGTFGQVALDPQTDTLYITENASSETRIWVVAGASSQYQDASIGLQALQVSGDTGGTGVAAGSGSVYAFMVDGSGVGIDALTGPRLRKGTSAAFPASSVILGSLTGLDLYGALALDTANGYLFAARHNTDAGSTAAPVLAFKTGQFGTSYNQAPAQTLGSGTAQADLRVLAHPGTKDWLVGLRGQGSVAMGEILLWKSPLGGTAAKVVTVSPAGSLFKGVAVDGNAS